MLFERVLDSNATQHKLRMSQICLMYATQRAQKFGGDTFSTDFVH